MLARLSPSRGDPSPKHSSPPLCNADPGCGAAVHPSGKVRHGVSRQPVPVKTCLSELSAGKAASEGSASARHPHVAFLPSSRRSAGSNGTGGRVFLSSYRGGKNITWNNSSVHGKCWVAACVDLSRQKEAVGLIILPKSNKMQNFPESQVPSWLFSETCPSLETLFVWMGRVFRVPG